MRDGVGVLPTTRNAQAGCRFRSPALVEQNLSRCSRENPAPKPSRCSDHDAGPAQPGLRDSPELLLRHIGDRLEQPVSRCAPGCSAIPRMSTSRGQYIQHLVGTREACRRRPHFGKLRGRLRPGTPQVGRNRSLRLGQQGRATSPLSCNVLEAHRVRTASK